MHSIARFLLLAGLAIPTVVAAQAPTPQAQTPQAQTPQAQTPQAQTPQAPSAAQMVAAGDGRDRATVFDLPLGAHAREMPVNGFMEFACGTNGGPPALRLGSWLDFAKCRPDADTGLYEVYYRYDDELEYWARAHNLDMQVLAYQYTEAYNVPMIVSALFDADGFYVGLRMASDTRVDVALRELGVTLGDHLMGRYDPEGWACTDLPRRDGESEFKGVYIKKRCTKQIEMNGLAVAATSETHNFRRLGQAALDPRDINVATEGQFESSSWFQVLLAEPLANRAARLAAIEALGPAVPDPVIARAMNCPGCDLSGANLKWANLTGANLAGANLFRANLHGAILDHANLAGANLEGANFNRATLRLADLHEANLKGAMFFSAIVDGADLAKTDLTRALAASGQFVRTDFSGAMLYLADLRNARLSDANFTGANLENAWMHNAQMIRANFSGAGLNYVVAQATNMVEANFTGVDARGGEFREANLRGANLTNADFSFTILTAVNLFGAKLDGAKFEESDLPAGFVPPLATPN